MRVHWPASVRLRLRARCREQEELKHCQQVDTCCWSSMAVTINHLTFATISLQGGIYYVLMSAKWLWEIAASTERVWKILMLAFSFGFVLVGLIFSEIIHIEERRGFSRSKLSFLASCYFPIDTSAIPAPDDGWEGEESEGDILKFRGCQSRRWAGEGNRRSSWSWLVFKSLHRIKGIRPFASTLRYLPFASLAPWKGS